MVTKKWKYPCKPISNTPDFKRDCGHCDCPNTPCDGFKKNLRHLEVTWGKKLFGKRTQKIPDATTLQNR